MCDGKPSLVNNATSKRHRESRREEKQSSVSFTKKRYNLPLRKGPKTQITSYSYEYALRTVLYVPGPKYRCSKRVLQSGPQAHIYKHVKTHHTKTLLRAIYTSIPKPWTCVLLRRRTYVYSGTYLFIPGTCIRQNRTTSKYRI